MSSLSELQKNFVNGLNGESPLILEQICSSVRLTIYQESIIGNLQKTLKSIYPVCCKLVGEEFFTAMSNEYIAITPSTSPDLAEYGVNFADFIANFPPARSLPYLTDVARLEWAWHRIFSAPTPPNFDFQQLAVDFEKHTEQLIFLIPEKSFLISSSFPIHRIWEINQDGYAGEDILTLEQNKKYFYFVWRKKLELRIDTLNEMEWQLFQWLAEQKTIGEIAARIADFLPEYNFEEILPQWIDRGWIASFTTCLLSDDK